ncbi:hypothetical protein ALI44B_00155 [Leifsonia sp. ALI-44-B]|nr:hypothetical protein ALI44B_00155 [Leifsonia sp. ALI-44-B]
MRSNDWDGSGEVDGDGQSVDICPKMQALPSALRKVRLDMTCFGISLVEGHAEVFWRKSPLKINKCGGVVGNAPLGCNRVEDYRPHPFQIRPYELGSEFCFFLIASCSGRYLIFTFLPCSG